MRKPSGTTFDVEHVEHRGGRHLAPRVPASRAGGVVHDDHGRDSTDVFEHLDQPVAQAFRVLPGQARHVAHVRMGERDDQAVVVHELAGDAGLRHAEIDLRDAGRPDELAVPVGTAPVRLAPASHVPRRRRVLAVVAGLRAEPVVHAFGGVALLAGAACGRPRAIRRPTPRTGRSWSRGACPWAVSASYRPYRRISRQWRGPRPASSRSPTWTLPDGPVS